VPIYLQSQSARSVPIRMRTTKGRIVTRFRWNRGGRAVVRLRKSGVSLKISVLSNQVLSRPRSMSAFDSPASDRYIGSSRAGLSLTIMRYPAQQFNKRRYPQDYCLVRGQLRSCIDISVGSSAMNGERRIVETHPACRTRSIHSDAM